MNSNIRFQAVSWSYKHEPIDDNEYDKRIIIQIFGRTEDNKTIYVEVLNFNPCFYIKCTNNYRNIINNCLDKLYKNKQFIKISNEFEKYSFYYFTGDEKQKFVKVISKNYDLLKRFSYECKNNNLELFESNKEPIIQFLHEIDIKPCGWITIDETDVTEIENTINKITNSEINIQVEWNKINYLENYENKIQEFTLCGFDIECISSDDGFPIANRKEDKIVSIAATFSKLGYPCYYKVILIIGDCPKIDNVKVYNCKDEKQLIVKWCKVIQQQDPDFICGWNNFGFDELYINERAKLLNIEKYIKLSRLLNEETKFINKKLASSALGDNELFYYDMTGRVVFDLMKIVQREYKLSSYKLDAVASYFFRELLKSIENKDNKTIIETNTTGFFKGQYFIIVRNDGVADYEIENNKKFQIIDIIDNTHLIIDYNIDKSIFNEKGKLFCCQVKDDVKPKEIFEKYKSGIPEDLKQLSLYNIQDCELCNKLCEKLCVIINNCGMANVCNVPVSYIFLRGQGVKIFSLVSKKCKERGYLIPLIGKKDISADDTFEGAVVFDPIPGVYYSPICVSDANSLYPSSLICRNISHECIVQDKKYMELYKDTYTFTEINYKAKEIKKITKKSNNSENIINVLNKNNNDVDEELHCIVARNKDQSKIGIIPEILQFLLDNRKNVRKMQAIEPDEFKKKIYEGLQLAYKITANSLYGQCGASTSSIYLKAIACATTATGRFALNSAKEFIEVTFNNMCNYALTNKIKYIEYVKTLYDKTRLDTKIEKNKHYESVYKNIRTILNGFNVKLKVIYGDTDSVFYDFNTKDNKTGILQTGKEMREKAIKLGIIASDSMSLLMPKPLRFEYEKTLHPFVIITKKRYVGNLYEKDPNKFFQKNMGIVLKRRDNAQIVKYIVGGVVDKLLNIENQELSQKEALEFAKKSLYEMIDDKFNINMFIITKTLQREYKNRQQIAHAVLADRITKRDPGNKPSSNDRIPYAFIQVDENNIMLQGDRIETPDFIKEHNLKLDYNYYIDHQIKEPCLQFLELFDKNAKQIFTDAMIYASTKSRGCKIDSIFDYIENNNNCDNDDF